ncbi:GSCFA domain-containing protein [Flavobacteriaceae bacterium TP-CH-4]|uniref:GSCFA domain-containing protein n=1 Tax=Pelagihabitans pacificus TaxID=2696054 RepID=A0A967AVY7_9FLAO|nr:GSCFA domain-containing protein [Pelagihabitans pacificus]NHF61416.1 GSCFA domain-containing protein [Pelagihabitans pacificus]
MKLRTEIPLPPSDGPIDYRSRLLLLGSCFSEHIGSKLNYYQFQVVRNPFGILFHPKAIENLIDRAVNDKKYIEEDLFSLNGQWHSFDAHSDRRASSDKKLMDQLNHGLKTTFDQLRQSTHVVLTLGTAWVYRHLESDRIVANCHKVPQREFAKELLSVGEIVESLKHILKLVQSKNVNSQVVLTISPVRHLKDGFIENQRSKAHLITAVHELLSVGTESINTHYFPSYEIMMDELRDYRFYEPDMVHPNQVGIQYIWEKFRQTFISSEVFGIMDKVEEIQKGLAHRPFNPLSEQHQEFLRSLERKITYLEKQYPHMRLGFPN